MKTSAFLVAALLAFVPVSGRRARDQPRALDSPQPPLSLTPPPSRAAAIASATATTTPASSPSSEATRDRIAARWAPTIYQETKTPSDLITAFDFDGDWDGSNNAAHARAASPSSLRAVVYFTVVETATHYLITYLPYHPVDEKAAFGHDHDTEHITAVIRKTASSASVASTASAASADGELEALDTRFHKWNFQYAAPAASVGSLADDVDGPIHLESDGHPSVNAQRVGHGICGGLSPNFFIDTLSLRCVHGTAPRIQKQGVVYRYRGTAGAPRSLDDRDVGYALVEIGGSLWAHARKAGPHLSFANLVDFDGERCGRYTCPHGIGGALLPHAGHNTTVMPWDESPGRGVKKNGDAFLDPAFTLSHRLSFRAPFSTDYSYNPYLGVGAFSSPGAPPPAFDPHAAPMVTR